jgi:hypothetical protein
MNRGVKFEVYKRDRAIQPRFRPHRAMIYDERVLNFPRIDRASRLTLDGRIELHFRFGADQAAGLDRLRGQAALLYRNGVFYLACTADALEPDPGELSEFLGVDLGVINIATTSGGKIVDQGAVAFMLTSRQCALATPGCALSCSREDRMLTEAEKAYAAGLFDGEGSIIIDKPRGGKATRSWCSLACASLLPSLGCKSDGPAACVHTLILSKSTRSLRFGTGGDLPHLQPHFLVTFSLTRWSNENKLNSLSSSNPTRALGAG